MTASDAARVPKRCNGQQLHAVVSTAAGWLQAYAPEVDALNVYPVPDGDTGSNMSQTMRAAAEEGAACGETDAGRYAASLAHGALMGARGNSGVILSQLLRGFARSLATRRAFSPAELAAALQEASATAYRGVAKPVEGTVLTVARMAAEGATRAATERADFRHVLDGAVRAARVALAETQNQLPVLRQAGVVDAGGRGYLLILEGALRYLQGKGVPAPELVPSPGGARADASTHARFEHAAASAFGYCTEFLIAGRDLDEERVRIQLAPLGDSLLVVGDGEILRVHIHTDDPGRALTFAGGLGRLRKVKIDDMQAQHEEFAAEVEPLPRQQDSHEERQLESLPVGVVAAATGLGFARLLSSLGARVVPGGQTMNPSTEQILAAIEACPQSTVIVLPNNRNVVSTAQQAAGLSGKVVHVVGTATVPQGIAALLAMRLDDAPATMVEAMGDAARQVRTAELTIAVREVEIDGMQVRRGDMLGLLDGTVVVAGHDLGAVACEVLDLMPAEEYEMITVYPGAEVNVESVERLMVVLGERYPRLAVEQVEGGQPHYQFILSVE